MKEKSKATFAISLINQCQTEFFTVISRSGELGRNNGTRTNSNRAYNASKKEFKFQRDRMKKVERKKQQTQKREREQKKTRSDSCCCPPTDN